MLCVVVWCGGWFGVVWCGAVRFDVMWCGGGVFSVVVVVVVWEVGCCHGVF